MRTGGERPAAPVLVDRLVAPDAAGPATPATGTSERPEAGGLVAQIVARAHLFSTARGKGVRMRLDPPDLGSIDVRLVVESGLVTLRIQAETVRARELIEFGWPRLQESLAERGLRADRLEIGQSALGGGGLGFASSGYGDSSSGQSTPPYVFTSRGNREARPEKDQRQPGESDVDPASLIDYRV